MLLSLHQISKLLFADALINPLPRPCSIQFLVSYKFDEIKLLISFYSGNLTPDLESTVIHSDAILYLRNTKLIALWEEAVKLVYTSCDNVKSRKYSDTTILTACPLNIHLMPLPSIMVAFPKLRYSQFFTNDHFHYFCSESCP